jgi:pyridoxine 5-phosphate synthase
VAAEKCLAAGADGITAHLREDRRHIVDADVGELRAVCTRAGRTFNLEMAATDEMVAIAVRVRPDVCTLVPERREERTTEGGLDAVAGGEALARRVRTLVGAGIKVSLFIAADALQIERSRAVGATQVELHTGEYAHGREGELARLADGAKRAHGMGLEVAAGHGLTQENTPALVGIPEIVELNIGHAVISDAVFVGIADAVRAYRAAIERGASRRPAVS